MNSSRFNVTALGFFVANQIFALSVIEQVNNATARVMTNKKLVSPYANGEGLSTLPYGKKSLSDCRIAFYFSLQSQGCLHSLFLFGFSWVEIESYGERYVRTGALRR